METTVEYTDKVMYVSSDFPNIIRKIKKYREQYPDEVEITQEPEHNDGCICAKLPTKWLKISPPIKREMTDEQRKAAAERMRAFAQKQKEARLARKQD